MPSPLKPLTLFILETRLGSIEQPDRQWPVRSAGWQRVAWAFDCPSDSRQERELNASAKTLAIECNGHHSHLDLATTDAFKDAPACGHRCHIVRLFAQNEREAASFVNAAKIGFAALNAWGAGPIAKMETHRSDSPFETSVLASFIEKTLLQSNLAETNSLSRGTVARL